MKTQYRVVRAAAGRKPPAFVGLRRGKEGGAHPDKSGRSCLAAEGLYESSNSGLLHSRSVGLTAFACGESFSPLPKWLKSPNLHSKNCDRMNRMDRIIGKPAKVFRIWKNVGVRRRAGDGYALKAGWGVYESLTRLLPLARPSRACGFAQWSSRSCQVFPIIEIVAVATSKPFAPAHAAQVEFFRPVNQNYWPRRLVRDAPVKPN